MDNSPAAHGLSIANFGNLVLAVVEGEQKTAATASKCRICVTREKVLFALAWCERVM